ncbi:LysR family transcriptional regulator [Pendulispora brunnea]|uniref:LysR family transcriptional regulator n=1 Tax=Pendulispora brunnea TaxID=2905690 RepID=A0ABZ2K2U8_9BACT
MDYEWLFSFVVFAEHLNFTHAAKQLHISQPALHVQIKKLTEAVGRPLYRRNGKALVLTPEGKRLAAHGREVQERGRSVLEELRGQSSSGPVVLAAGQGAFLYLLGPAIRRFPKEAWPLRLLSMNTPQALEAVREAKAHLGVVVLEHPPSDLACTRLCSVGQMVVLPASHRLAKRRMLRPSDLAGERLVVAPEGSPHRTMLEHLLREHGLEPQVAVEATGWEPMLQFARYGIGLTVVNDFCPVPKGLLGIRLEGAPAAIYWLLHRPDFGHRGVEAMRKLVVETIPR